MSPADRDSLALKFLPESGSAPVEWTISDKLVDYETALAAMNERVEEIISGDAPEQVWLLEHPRFTLPEPARTTAISFLPIGFLFTAPAVVASTHITGPANGLPMSCWT